MRMVCTTIGVLSLILFYIVSWQVKKDRFKQLNFDTTIRLQDNMPKRLGGYWEDLTFFVEPVPSIVLVGVLTLAALFNFKKKKFHLFALIIPLLFGMVVVTEIYGKAKVESPAPPFFMLKNPTTIFPKFHVQESYSYPSGHAARSLFLAIMAIYIVLQYTKRKVPLFLATVICLGYVVLVSIGKVFLGQHWLSDIIGGYLVALAFGSFGGVLLLEKSDSRFWEEIEKKIPAWKKRNLQ